MTHELGLTKTNAPERIVGNQWIFSDSNHQLTPANYIKYPRENWSPSIQKLFSEIKDNYTNPYWNFENLLVWKTEENKLATLVFVYSDPKSNRVTRDYLIRPSLVGAEYYLGIERIDGELLSSALAGTNYVVYDATCSFNRVKKTEKVWPFSKQTHVVYYMQSGVAYINLSLNTIDRVVEIENGFMDTRRQMLEESFADELQNVNRLLSQKVENPVSLF